eukprot:6715763-Pyramimonas_sp.AAC.1
MPRLFNGAVRSLDDLPLSELPIPRLEISRDSRGERLSTSVPSATVLEDTAPVGTHDAPLVHAVPSGGESYRPSGRWPFGTHGSSSVPHAYGGGSYRPSGGHEERRGQRRAPRRAQRRALNFVTYNANGWQRLRSFLEEGAAGAHLVASQEVRVRGDDRRLAEEWCAKNGWKAFITDCLAGPTGAMMAGAGLFVRSYIGVTYLDSLPHCHDHVLVPSWCVGVYVHGGPRGGFLAGSIYLQQGLGLEQENIDRLERLGEVLRFYRAPFVFGGDWNLPPRALSESEFVAKVDGHLIVADEGSHRVAKTGTYTFIDYWLASDSMASVMGKPRRVHDYAPRPHYPMFVSLGAKPRAQQ